MYSERLEPITLINGVSSKKTYHVRNYELDDVEERKRILNFIPKPCPKDFPWPEEWHWAQFSLTPYQSVIMKKNNSRSIKR
jgi:hypothetical protein